MNKLDISSLPSLPLEQHNQLPNVPAIYFVLSQDKPVYIGQTMRLAHRLGGHFRLAEFTELPSAIVAWFAVETSTTREQLLQQESAFIKRFRPEMNVGDGGPNVVRRPSAPDSKRRQATPPPQRGPGGRKPRVLTLDIGTEAMSTLRLLAAAQETTVEALAAGWLGERIKREYEEYSTQVSCLVEEWKEEIL